MTNNLPVLVTGAAGFIGYHVAHRLASNGCPVVGIDNLNAYYDPKLKQARLDQLATFPRFRFTSSTSPTAPGWRIFSQLTAFPRSCTSPPRRACATP